MPFHALKRDTWSIWALEKCILDSAVLSMWTNKVSCQVLYSAVHSIFWILAKLLNLFAARSASLTECGFILNFWYCSECFIPWCWLGKWSWSCWRSGRASNSSKSWPFLGEILYFICKLWRRISSGESLVFCKFLIFIIVDLGTTNLCNEMWSMLLTWN